MTKSTVNEMERMVVTRVFDAPRELVWKAWMEWTPKLRQANKTHFSANGELCHGSESTEVHARV
jgi:hypothetical protein